jgi:hypothetical protein
MLSAVEERCREELIAQRRMGVLSGSYPFISPLDPQPGTALLGWGFFCFHEGRHRPFSFSIHARFL